MQSRSTVVAALAVAGALALSACSGDDDPAPTSSTSTSSSSSSSTTPSTTTTPPTTSTTANVTVPPEAQKHTEEGAKAFAKFFVDVLNHSQVASNSSGIKSLSGEGCKGCKVYADLADDLKSKNQHLDRDALVVRGLAVRPDSSPPNTYVLDLLIDEKASRTLNSKGGVVETFDADKLTYRATLDWKANSWSTTQLVLVQ